MRPAPLPWVAALVLACGAPETPDPADPDGGPAARDAAPEAGPEDAGALSSPEAGEPEDLGTAEPNTVIYLDDSAEATVRVLEEKGDRRSYALASTARLLAGTVSPRRVDEEQARLRSSNLGFDALYAMARAEARENSVATIADGAFGEGAPLPCPPGGCFETGRLWNYVWTRDTAYAAHLGLAAFDPLRVKNSLEFKFSPRRGGGDLQFVQDTGTGGSYPVSTDRVVLALGGEALLPELPTALRAGFAARFYAALENTVEHDRVVVFDPEDGLYRGETSFLDWREQSYPAWMAAEPAHIARSKALSTNVLHAAALRVLASGLRASGRNADAARYTEWRRALVARIRHRFQIPGSPIPASYLGSDFDPAPVRRSDLLGLALAGLEEVYDPAELFAALTAYPVFPSGPPVVWPVDPVAPIYHNQAIWPFVTAYGLFAARAADHSAFAAAMIASLVRGAGLNLSNLENLELFSGEAFVEDGVRSGPVVNSPRQLWSVAGFLALVERVLFGVETGEGDGLRFSPYVPFSTHRGLLLGASSVELRGLVRGERSFDLTLRFPRAEIGEGAFVLEAIRAGDRTYAEAIPPDVEGKIELILVAKPSGATLAPVLARQLAPHPAEIRSVVANAAGLEIASARPAPGLRTDLYRDGRRLAEDVPDRFIDTSARSDGPSYCYVAESVDRSSGLTSHRSAPQCYWGAPGERVWSYSAETFRNRGGRLISAFGQRFFEGWGEPGDELVLEDLTVPVTGRYALQLVYGNGAGPLSTGVSCAVKRLEVFEEPDRLLVQDYVIMPQVGDWAAWRDAPPVWVAFEAGKRYRVRLGADERAINMSAFEHFSRYSGGLGGRGGSFLHVNIARLKVLDLRGAAAGRCCDPAL